MRRGYGLELLRRLAFGNTEAMGEFTPGLAARKLHRAPAVGARRIRIMD